MPNDASITNILSITGAGLIILLTGISFLLFRDYFSNYLRYFLPIPPIAVAAYIFVFNLFQHYSGNLTNRFTEAVKDIMLSVGIMALSFTAFVGLLILFVGITRRFF